MSPAVITVKKDKSIKIALDSRKLNEATIKKKAQMPNMEELISRISRKISEEQEGEIWITKLDFDYAYGQIKLNENTRNLCIFTVTGGEFTGYYRFLKGFYGLADIPTFFQERIDRTLEFKHPAWLDDIIIVTKGTIEKHESEVKETMKKLDEAGYRLHPKKCENKKRPEYQKPRYKDNRCGQCGAPNWSRQHICPAKLVDCRNCKKRGHYEKMCRLPKRIQHVDKVSSSAEEDNWDDNKIQRRNNNKKNGEYLHATLLVNNAPIKFIIDSGSPGTLIPQRLFNKITEVKELKTNYKDVNDNKIDFLGQTKALVKTNSTTLQLPLLITKTNITPLMGLD